MRSQVDLRPRGQVLVIVPFNYPLQLSMVPLITAIAAGNTVVLKLSDKTPASSLAIKELIEKIFPLEWVFPCILDAKDSKKLLQEDFDFVFFTGSTRTGKNIAEELAQRMIPYTLELGGKSPAIILKDADLKLSVKKILWSKTLNAGQTCVAVDYVCVPSHLKNKFIKYYKQAIDDFYPQGALMTEGFTKMVDKKALLRNLSYAKNQIVHHGMKSVGLSLEPSLIEVIDIDAPIMKEEIFGLVLALIAYDNENDLDNILKLNPCPLAFYVFTVNKREAIDLMDKYKFGGGAINETLLHLSNEKIPFGGIGNSGIGMYHGYEGFKSFSHQRSLIIQSNKRINHFLYPPYKGFVHKIVKKNNKIKDSDTKRVFYFVI